MLKQLSVILASERRNNVWEFESLNSCGHNNDKMVGGWFEKRYPPKKHFVLFHCATIAHSTDFHLSYINDIWNLVLLISYHNWLV